MKSLSMIALLMGALFATTGCETPAYTATENSRNVARVYSYDLRQTTDDWNRLWLQDRPDAGTTWSVQ
jgi:hypothetical protein